MQEETGMIPELPPEALFQKEKMKGLLQKCVAEKDINALKKASDYLIELYFIERRKVMYFMNEAASLMHDRDFKD
mgnify:CR=1|tara:strand:+ start:116 stop:340 length:225 start_codon:yes stop_codon:yes gene_type:complete